jgi:hypothetical protein
VHERMGDNKIPGLLGKSRSKRGRCNRSRRGRSSGEGQESIT